ncbi:hypothetical protein E2562_019509 [Oryza meyeriana var. granulata]|uniref:Uncharacterized protein n=1 Tax=Oryza meyeriana var. granulata TaxID=110450 RepID=A0A6G1CGS3_9ORYZ|nr:hypothetical protein E2562_019509 [Oryza meyeriana var. granulata]
MVGPTYQWEREVEGAGPDGPLVSVGGVKRWDRLGPLVGGGKGEAQCGGVDVVVAGGGGRQRAYGATTVSGGGGKGLGRHKQS